MVCSEVYEVNDGINGFVHSIMIYTHLDDIDKLTTL